MIAHLVTYLMNNHDDILTDFQILLRFPGYLAWLYTFYHFKNIFAFRLT